VNDIKDAIDGKLTMTERIEKNIDMISTQRVPQQWIDDGFSTNRKLPTWLQSIDLRIQQYKLFEAENAPPKIVFINRLFNPLSYLTAIRQSSAQKSGLELDKLIIITEPTSIDLRNQKDGIQLPKEGSLVYGCHLQGARWDEENRIVDESKPREAYCIMPVINCKVEDASKIKAEDKSIYHCPVYRTTKRDATYVFTAQFKTKANPAKWTIAGVAVILDVELGDSVEKFKVNAA
jgi:dynein heavy chain